MKSKFKQTEIGMIPEEWDVEKLGDNVDKIFCGRDPEGGKKSHSNEKTKYAIIQSAPVFDGFLDREKIGHISKERYDDFKSASLIEEDVLLNQLGDGITFARSCVVPNEVLPAIITRSVGCIRCNKKRLYPWFLNAFLILPKTKEYIESFNSGSSRRAIDGAKMKSFLIPIPLLTEQEKIGHYYKTIQDKTELNKQMNKTLESIGQAIFKHWFIDFEFPNEKGKPYKSSGGEMVDSELGKIPKGWLVKRIKECGQVICGKTPPTKDKDNYGEDIFFITIPDMHNKIFVINTERKISRKGADTQRKKELPLLSVCVSCIATPGIVILTSEKSHTNQQINSIICNNRISPYFMYLAMKEKAEEIKIKGLGGTATLNLNTGDFENIKLIIPDKEIITMFHKSIGTIFEKIQINEYKIQNLSQIRDSLLPKLMSGKIRVPVEVRK